ncbi:hypothetical protein [Mammaliicoccus sciuri]|uniref:hypothetical protein n=1 Tax=Mammaliicoccus sciuri TaxID=1296 RepID=UPI001F103090|nr:hypothetical protein [Mammaliicoccus sciuri]MCH5141744.1 hypothetical protein [Mammaliicoccus sciuri]MEB6696399.1 hypothetical protein [Mammaliicoccus sciuri]WQK42517.1 hypothetical protein P3T89_00485 [Mammaliicoccus sciuri]
MELDKVSYFKIFENNFDFEIENTIVGKAVKMDSYNAFLYTISTGSVYLDNIYYPFTPKGLTKILNDFKSYNIISGLFDDYLIKNSPFLLNNNKHFIFNSSKFIIPVEFTNEVDYQKQLRHMEHLIKTNNLTSTDFIIQRIEISKKGNGMEPFMEYIACLNFKNSGHIVENQTPLTYKLGSPDFISWAPANIMKRKGIFLTELMMLRLYPQKIDEIEKIIQNNIEFILVGEVKTSTFYMNKQIQKYLSAEIFDFAFEIHPFKKESTTNGLLSFQNIDMNIKKVTPPSRLATNKIKRNEYLLWLNNYLKLHILANFSNNEINEISEKYLKRKINSQSDIISLIKVLNKDELFYILKKIIHTGKVN